MSTTVEASPHHIPIPQLQRIPQNHNGARNSLAENGRVIATAHLRHYFPDMSGDLSRIEAQYNKSFFWKESCRCISIVTGAILLTGYAGYSVKKGYAFDKDCNMTNGSYLIAAIGGGILTAVGGILSDLYMRTREQFFDHENRTLHYNGLIFGLCNLEGAKQDQKWKVVRICLMHLKELPRPNDRDLILTMLSFCKISTTFKVLVLLEMSLNEWFKRLVLK